MPGCIVRILMKMESPFISEAVENCPQQVALNPTNMSRLPFEIVQETLLMPGASVFFREVPPLSRAHPPGIVSEYFRSPVFSQLIKAAINKTGKNIFFIGQGIG